MSEVSDAAGQEGSFAVGFAAAVGATVTWGVLPIYWKSLAAPPFEVLAHRILWTVLFTLVALLFLGRLRALAATLRSPRRLLALALSSFLINTNGFLFIWGVVHDRITEVSLGYYITPLLNVLLGFLVFRERPSRLQTLAIGLATVAVLNLTLRAPSVPYVGLGVAAAFGFYGVVRKAAPVEPLVGLTGEMSLAAPFAFAFLALQPTFFGVFPGLDADDQGLLMLTGVLSAAPLWAFTVAAKNLPYATVGMFLYVAPTLQLLLALFYYGEAFTALRGVTFVLLWFAIALYLGDSVRRARRPAPGTIVPRPETAEP